MRAPKPFYRRFNDCWYVQLGKRQIPLAKGKANEKEAYRRYYEIMADHPRGHDPTLVADPTVALLCDRFLDWCQKHNAPRTFEWYRDFLQDLCDHVGTLPALKLRPYDVTQWLDRHPRWQEARRGAIIAVKRVYNWSTEQGLIDRNPIKALKKPPAKARDRLLSSEERQQIFDSVVPDDPFRDFLVALQETGARPGEIATVTAADVDLSTGVWILAEHKTKKRSRLQRPRVIILTPTMLELTRRLVDRQPEGPLFRNAKGGAWNRNAIRCRFRRIRKKLDLGPDLCAYLYRHSYATDALERGVSLAEVCELLGHTSTEMVMRHYNHLRDRREHLRQAAAKATQPKT